MVSLSTPLHIGRNQLQHRLVMAPLTRFRADDAHVPLDMVTKYYEQRASVPGTMLITEATFIHPAAAGYASIPGIWSAEQVTGWRKVTDAVHAKKSFIYLQLWALGRAASPDNLKAEGGYDLISSGDIAMDADHQAPRPLTEPEIQDFIGYYVKAAKNAVEAGFDGVEIHGANGYLIDQFLQDVSNNRTDKYGGSIENRSRFGLEVTAAIVDAIGADRVGYRVSPFSTFQGMKMKDPVPQFAYHLTELGKLGLAYIHMVVPRISGATESEHIEGESLEDLVAAWSSVSKSPVLYAGGFNADTAVKALDELKDKNAAIVFGRYFIANPDLPFRILNGIPLEPYDRSTFYVPRDAKGYITYPFSREFEAANPTATAAA